jgi:DNA-binding GntR family transcriptional regulator
MENMTTEVKKNSKEDAYNSIQDLIFSMEIQPGQNITENALSTQLGIGRTPIREALTRLESEGLIHSSKGRKTVYSLTLTEIKEIFNIKYALEGAIAGWAATNGSDEDRKLLAQTMNEMKALVQNRTEDDLKKDFHSNTWIETDAKLHRIIFRMANCKKAEDIIQKLNLQWHRTRVSVYALEGRIARSAKEHESFVQHIIEGNAQKAEEAMKAHLTNLTQEIEQMMKLFNFNFR